MHSVLLHCCASVFQFDLCFNVNYKHALVKWVSSSENESCKLCSLMCCCVLLLALVFDQDPRLSHQIFQCSKVTLSFLNHCQQDILPAVVPLTSQQIWLLFTSLLHFTFHYGYAEPEEGDD